MKSSLVEILMNFLICLREPGGSDRRITGDKKNLTPWEGLVQSHKFRKVFLQEIHICQK